MQHEFNQLAEKFARYAPAAPAISDAAWDAIRSQVCVVIPAGGESKRLRGTLQKGFNKISVPLPNGDTLLEYNIRMYRDAGINDFLLLVGHAANTVEDLIGDGSRLGVQVRYSHDPEQQVATGGAIRWALHRGLLDTKKYMIVHNGGDIFYGYPGSLPRDFVTQHLYFEKKGSMATILSVPLSLVQGSVLKVVDGYVEDISYYTYVPMPYHAAATLCSPAIYKLFEKMFAVGEKMEFERTLFPHLALGHKLTAMKVDNQYFLPVKNEKQWEQLLQMFSDEASK